MQRLGNHWASLVAVSLLIAAIATWYLTNGPGPEVAARSGVVADAKSTPSRADSAVRAVGSSNSASSPVDALPAQNLSRSVAEIEDWSEYFQRENVYAAATELNAKRGPGSYALSVQLSATCLDAWLAISRGALRDATNSPDYQRRLQAESKLRMRCEAFNSSAALNVSALHPADVNGRKYLDAKAIASDVGNLRKPEVVVPALRELAHQGFLANDGLTFISFNKIWNGVSWRERPEVFESAVRLAREAVRPVAGAEPADTRRLILCYQYGRCDKEAISLAPTMSPGDQADARRLAAEIEAALRRRDYRAFVGEKINGP